jgi:FkbM family methyltransferase
MMTGGIGQSVTLALAGAMARLPCRLQWRLRGLPAKYAAAWPDWIPDRMVRVRRHGLTWTLNPRDYICQDVFWTGTKDEFEMAFISRNVRAGARILDIGANFGWYSLLLAQGLQQECRIDAFEPHPVTSAWLRQHLAMNRITCVALHAEALGEREASLAIHDVKHNSGGAHLDAAVPSPGDTTVRVTTLDQFAEDAKLERLDFVKLDVEGFERAVLAGGARTLARFTPPLMVEVCPANLARQGCTAADLLAQLRQLGYVDFRVCSWRGVEEFTQATLEGGLSYWNVFCFGKDSDWDITPTLRRG